MHNSWQMDQAILGKEEQVVVVSFGHNWDTTSMKMDEILHKVSNKVKNYAVVYLLDISKDQDLNKPYDMYGHVFYQYKLLSTWGQVANNKTMPTR